MKGPWTELPPTVADALAPELPRLSDEIVAAISETVPGYARDLEGEFGRALRAGVEEALRQFTEMVASGAQERGPGREVYVNLGRGEMRAGRSLDALLAAYRLGARIAWRRLAAAGERARLKPRTLYLLAESIFAYIDELSGESIEGYAMEQAASAGERQRQRRRLAGLLLREPTADRTAVQAAAAEASWPLPDRLAALVTDGEDPDRLALRLGTDVVAAELGSRLCALIPDPGAPGRHGQLKSVLGRRRAAIGPVVGWREAALSAARARATLALASTEGLMRADDHALALLLDADPRLSRDIRQRALAPLDDETESSRARLTDTLRAWLRGRGRTERVAAELHVHPQTVRYRLGRLRELYGRRLDDPDFRFELEVALRSAG